MQVAQECVIVDPEFFLYMMLPNGTQAFGTALFFIMLGYGFLNLSGACQQTLLFHFIVFLIGFPRLLAGDKEGNALSFAFSFCKGYR